MSGPIPGYAMLDVWMALNGSERSNDFEAWYDERGYAEAWAQLMSEVRGRVSAPPTSPTREYIRSAVFPVLVNASNFPRPVQARLLGQDMTPLVDKVIDAVLFALITKESSNV